MGNKLNKQNNQLTNNIDENDDTINRIRLSDEMIDKSFDSKLKKYKIVCLYV